MDQNKRTPQVRFKGCTDAWKQRKLGDVAERVIVGLATSVTPYYRESGIPIFRNLNIKENYLDDSDILFLDEKYAKTQESKKIHTGDVLSVHTGYIGVSCLVPEKYDDCLTFTTLITTPDKAAIDSGYLVHYLNSPKGMEAIQAVTTQGGRQNLNTNDFVKVPVPLPEIAEQPRISSFFNKIDDTITLHQRKYDKLLNLKEAMLEKMFPQNGSLYPEIRFKGFTDAWEQRKVGDITVELSEYANLEAGYPLFTSSRAGLMYQNDYRGSLTTDSKETLFSVVPIGACTYRHMSDDDVFHLNVNTLEKGLVSREYPVFFASEGTRLDFIVQYINSSVSFRAFCAEQKKGGTRTRLYYNALCEFKMMIPSQREQDAIADFFLRLDNLITLHQRKLEKLKNIKKACLEKMFV